MIRIYSYLLIRSCHGVPYSVPVIYTVWAERISWQHSRGTCIIFPCWLAFVASRLISILCGQTLSLVLVIPVCLVSISPGLHYPGVQGAYRHDKTQRGALIEMLHWVFQLR